jgi:serine/threonine protein kinase
VSRQLDLKPGNLVVDALMVWTANALRDSLSSTPACRLLSRTNTTIEGFCGTPPWVAPEVGTRDGPDMTYSPILADRWACQGACGRPVYYFETHLPDGGDDDSLY